MICNGSALLRLAPIKNMLAHKIKYQGVSHGLSEAGYDIRIKQEIRFCNPNAWHDKPSPRFVLASATEEFDMPDNLVGVVHDKSTWARQGLSVFNTVIEPGWKGFLTLELLYHGDDELVIPAGAGIAQVLFTYIECPGLYIGKYQNQSNCPVSAITSK